MPRLIRGSTKAASNPRRRAPCGFGIGREGGAAFYSEACARSRGGTRIHILYGYMRIRMAPAKQPPRLRYARKGANPTLETIEYVLGALQKSEGPISRNQVLATLPRWGPSTTRPSLNAALAFLGDEGMVAEGSKGLIWVPEASSQLLEAIRKGPHL